MIENLSTLNLKFPRQGENHTQSCQPCATKKRNLKQKKGISSKKKEFIKMKLTTMRDTFPMQKLKKVFYEEKT